MVDARKDVFETRHPAASGMTYHRHALPYMTVVLEGTYTEVVNDRPRTYRPGAVIVHTPDEEHADHFSSSTRCLNTGLPCLVLESGPVRVDAGVASIARRFTHAYKQGDASSLDVAVSELLSVAARAHPIPLQPDWLREITDIPEWTDAIPLNDLAKRCGIHPTHFSREFRRYVGTTPSAHRRRKRVERASHLLLNTSRSLAYIAASCGFTDQSHLNRAFALELGMSPGAFRRAFTR